MHASAFAASTRIAPTHVSRRPFSLNSGITLFRRIHLSFSSSCRQRTTHRRTLTASSKTPDVYRAELLEAEASKDWLKTFEIVTETGVLKIDLVDDAYESAIRTLAEGKQWQRAAPLLDRMLEREANPSAETFLAVIRALTADKQPEKARTLLEVLEQRAPTSSCIGPSRHLVIKSLAVNGQPLVSYELLDRLMTIKSKEGRPMLIHLDTYTSVCHALLKAGETEKAEEVLEWRDYLHDDE